MPLELPDTIDSESLLDDLLSRPSEAVIRTLQSTPGDIAVLGAGGKMGPTLTRMLLRAREATDGKRRVYAVSRFGNEAVREQLAEWGAETIAGDLLDESFVANLPSAENVFFLVGRKFGSAGEENFTWATNTYLPALVCLKYPTSRIVALSTGNVYGLKPIEGPGSSEADALHPRGEYAMSCLGRERIFEYFSRQRKTPVTIARLNYANELRYGVLVDIGRSVFHGAPVSLEMPQVNLIWQGDANAMIASSLADASAPPFPINVAGAERVAVQEIAIQMAKHMDRSVRFSGEEQSDALLSDSSLAVDRYGLPQVGLDQMIRWVADWIVQGGASLEKPTHFGVRDGVF